MPSAAAGFKKATNDFDSTPPTYLHGHTDSRLATAAIVA